MTRFGRLLQSITMLLYLSTLFEQRTAVCAFSNVSRGSRDCILGTATRSTTHKHRRQWCSAVTTSSRKKYDNSIRQPAQCFWQPITVRLFASAAATFTEESLGEGKREFQKALELYEINVKAAPTNVERILQELETEASESSFWDAENKERNAFVTSQISIYGRLVSRLNDWKTWKEDGEAALDMLTTDDNNLFTREEKESLLKELTTATQNMIEDGERYQLELLLSGPYDNQPCRILLTAGAGGTEANDWVADLKRMYERHADKLGFSVVVEDQQAGEVVGYKSVEMLISGGPGHPYGWFKGEKGAHRLVRLSPFNANNKRQTTFAG